jgi:hypothetical protein
MNVRTTSMIRPMSASMRSRSMSRCRVIDAPTVLADLRSGKKGTSDSQRVAQAPALPGWLPQAMLGPHGRQRVVQGQIHIEDLI